MGWCKLSLGRGEFGVVEVVVLGVVGSGLGEAGLKLGCGCVCHLFWGWSSVRVGGAPQLPMSVGRRWGSSPLLLAHVFRRRSPVAQALRRSSVAGVPPYWSPAWRFAGRRTSASASLASSSRSAPVGPRCLCTAACCTTARETSRGSALSAGAVARCRW